MTHGQRLERWRNHRKLTQAAMARKMGITRQAYNRYESGGSNMTEERVSAACGALGVTMSEYYGEVPAAPRRGAA